MRNRHAGAVVNFFMIVGLMIIGLILIFSLTRFYLLQKGQLNENLANLNVEKIGLTVQEAASFQGDSIYEVSINFPERYDLEVKSNSIMLSFPEEKINVSYRLKPTEMYIPESRFSNSNKIIVAKKGNIIIITNKLGCAENSTVCSPGCIALEKCPDSCLSSYEICNPYCFGSDNRNKANESLKDFFIPACYSEQFRGGIYEKTAIKSHDGICDPNTHSKKDGKCDSDCIGQNGVCDLDCNQPDPDCPSESNGICEPALNENCLNSKDCSSSCLKSCRASCTALFGKIGKDGCAADSMLKKEGEECISSCECQDGISCDITSHCCPKGKLFENGACVDVNLLKTCYSGSWQNCFNSPQACSCKKLNLGKCCPNCKETSKSSGCCQKGYYACGSECRNDLPDLKKGEPCSCTEQCGEGMSCKADPNQKNKRGCCPISTIFDSKKNECIETPRWKLVVVPLNYNLPSEDAVYRERAGTTFNYWLAKSPFKDCEFPNERAELLLLDKSDIEKCPTLNSACNADACTSDFGQCKEAMMACALLKYNDFDMVEGMYHGRLEGGVAGCSYLNGPYGSLKGGAIHDDFRQNEKGDGSVHEMGHDLGICHPKCPGAQLGGICDDVQIPLDKCEARDIMHRPPRDHFTLFAIGRMKQNPYLKDYLGGCT